MDEADRGLRSEWKSSLTVIVLREVGWTGLSESGRVGYHLAELVGCSNTASVIECEEWKICFLSPIECRRRVATLEKNSGFRFSTQPTPTIACTWTRVTFEAVIFTCPT